MSDTQTLVADDAEEPLASTRPEIPIVAPRRWVKENLFSSKSNTIQTFLFTGLMLSIVRWLLSLIFAEASDWTSVTTNMRLLFGYNYPAAQFIRVWFCLGIIIVAAMLTMGAWNAKPEFSLRKIAISTTAGGGFLAVIWFMCTVGFGFAPLQKVDGMPSGLRLGTFLLAALLITLGLGVLNFVHEPHKIWVKFTTMLFGFTGAVVAFLWLVPFGRYEFADGEIINESGTVATSTKVPWTYMMLLLVGAYFVGRWLRQFIPEANYRMVMVIWWLVGPSFLIFHVLRDPAFDMGYVFRVDIPMALAFGLGGGALLYALAKPGRGEIARSIGAVLLLFAAYNWLTAGLGSGHLFGWESMLQKARITFLMLSFAVLMAPTFSGEPAARRRFAYGWIGFIAIAHWLITGINTPSTLDIAAPPFLGGFVLTLAIAYYVFLASFPLGILMALARTSKLPLFRVMSTVYIEFIRGVPLITVLFFFSIMLNLFLPNGMTIGELGAIFVGYTLFSGAYMAENIRGGLQAIRKGQYEASDALGLTTVQRTMLIVLPQALRVTIPNLVGQAIGTFKETSLIAIVGGFDLLRIANSTIPAQSVFQGQKRPALLFVCFVYWVFSYSMSRASRRLEAKLGVGD